MGKITKVEGLNTVLRRLRKAKDNIGSGFEKGLKNAGRLLKRESMKQVPVDKSNLKNSSFIRFEGRGFDTEVWVGYTASYAIYVHENLDAVHGEAFNRKYAKEIARKTNKIHNRGKNQKAKFLEDPYKENIPEFIDLIKDAVDVKAKRT